MSVELTIHYIRLHSHFCTKCGFFIQQFTQQCIIKLNDEIERMDNHNRNKIRVIAIE